MKIFVFVVLYMSIASHNVLTGRWAIILCRLDTFLMFPDFLRSWVLGRSATRETTRILIAGPANTNWELGPVDTNWGSGLVNANWGPEMVNTNWGPGPANSNSAAGTDVEAGGQTKGRGLGNTKTVKA